MNRRTICKGIFLSGVVGLTPNVNANIRPMERWTYFDSGPVLAGWRECRLMDTNKGDLIRFVDEREAVYRTTSQPFYNDENVPCVNVESIKSHVQLKSDPGYYYAPYIPLFRNT